MTHTQQVLLSCITGLGLFSIPAGCSQSPMPSSPPPTNEPPSMPPVMKLFDAESGPHTAGKKVLVANGCFRCHTIHAARGPLGSGAGEGADSGDLRGGPELAKTSADPKYTVEWFMAYIRNPESKTMPRFEGKINEQDLRALAEYLASLK